MTGLNLKPPKEKCENVKCPWHGFLKVRGRVFKGIVKSSKTPNTAIVEWNYYQRIPKYERYERRKTKVVVYKPDCIKTENGDKVTIAECRPLSKTKKFVLVEVDKK